MRLIFPEEQIFPEDIFPFVLAPEIFQYINVYAGLSVIIQI